MLSPAGRALESVSIGDDKIHIRFKSVPDNRNQWIFFTFPNTHPAAVVGSPGAFDVTGLE